MNVGDSGVARDEPKGPWPLTNLGFSIEAFGFVILLPALARQIEMLASPKYFFLATLLTVT